MVSLILYNFLPFLNRDPCVFVYQPHLWEGCLLFSRLQLSLVIIIIVVMFSVVQNF